MQGVFVCVCCCFLNSNIIPNLSWNLERLTEQNAVSIPCWWSAHTLRTWWTAWPDSLWRPRWGALPQLSGMRSGFSQKQTTFDPWSSFGPIRSTVVSQDIGNCLSLCVRSLLKHYTRIIKWWIRVNADK